MKKLLLMAMVMVTASFFFFKPSVEADTEILFTEPFFICCTTLTGQTKMVTYCIPNPSRICYDDGSTFGCVDICVEPN